MTFPLYDAQGVKQGTVDAPALFQIEVNRSLIHRYVIWVQELLRRSTAHTKTRGEVSGGGKKPWKQKGTGRARVGSTRNPVWRTGGIAHGPRAERTYEPRMPRQERRKAFFSALSSRATEVSVLQAWPMTAPKTKDAEKVIEALKLSNRRVLHIIPAHEQVVERSLSNISNVTTKTVADLNVLDVLHSESILITPEGLAHLEQHFTPTV